MAFFAESRVRGLRWRSYAVSGLIHACAVAAILIALHRAPLTRLVLPGEQPGSMLTVIYSPAAGYAPRSKALHSAAAAQSSQHTMITAPSGLVAPTQVAAADSLGDRSRHDNSPEKISAMGLDSLGEGNVRIALGEYIPQPKPDLSAFPRGFEGDVVVDVLIDETGRIKQKTLVHGISDQVNEIVLATIEDWRFAPAERDGTAIPSKQELLFHFGPVNG